MNLYFAGAEHYHKELVAEGVQTILITLAQKRAIPKTPERYPIGTRLIIDSGAFTFFRNNTTMPPESWLQMVLPLVQFGEEIIALDVIGNAAKTFENYTLIRQELPNAIPTFHVGSEIKYLKRYLEQTDRIALGGMVPFATRLDTLRTMLLPIFALFSRESLPRFHAFGVFNKPILEMFPFASADASSWMSGSRYNRIENPLVGKSYVRSRDLTKERIRSVPLHDACLLTEYNGNTRIRRNIAQYLDLEHYLTQLWQKKLA